MLLKEELENYIPTNQQEEQDKSLCLYYLNQFPNALDRKNLYGHFCSNAFVVNSSKTKVLMVYHNIYGAWSLPGGHADGNIDLFMVAQKELQEETGVKVYNTVRTPIFSIDSLPVQGHFKKGLYVSAHTHLVVTYLFEIDENQKLLVNAQENSDVKWIPIEQVVCSSSEPHMRPVYQKLIDKLHVLK